MLLPSHTRVQVEKDVSSYTLVPYPNFEMQSKFQYVQSMEIDSKDRMWVLDTGRYHSYFLVLTLM